MSKHTPGQWEVLERNNSKVIPSFEIAVPTQTGGKMIIGSFDRKADAELSVRACNCHDELVAALELCIAAADDILPPTGANIVDLCYYAEKIRNVLIAAEAAKFSISKTKAQT